MNFLIRPYNKKDQKELILFCEKLLDHLASIDPFKTILRAPAYGKDHFERILLKVKQEDGIILVAEEGSRLVGWTVGIVKLQTVEDHLEYKPAKLGRILEVYVDPNFQGRGIGTSLILGIEKFLKQKGCSFLKMEVMATNENAHNLYSKLGYHDLDIDMAKLI